MFINVNYYYLDEENILLRLSLNFLIIAHIEHCATPQNNYLDGVIYKKCIIIINSELQ